MKKTILLRNQVKFIFFSLIFLFVSPVKAETTNSSNAVYGVNSVSSNWIGSISSDWTNPGNWSAGVPIWPADVIIFPSANGPIINGDFTINSLTVQAGATLNIVSGFLRIVGNLSNAGSIVVSSGASLVVMGTRSGAGTETINRTLRGGTIQSMVGSPVSNATIGELNANDVSEYNPSTGAFTTPASGATMTLGKGYFINGNTSLSLTGTINSGNITIGVVTTGDKFNLVANPFAAAISASDFFTTNSATITGTAYIWNDGGANVGSFRDGDFVTINSMGVVGVSTKPSTNPSAGSGTKDGAGFNGSFNSFQGFYVEATTAGNLLFSLSHQINGDNADNASFRKLETEISKVRLQLEGEGIANDILIALKEDATLGEDYSLDAKKRDGNELISFYSMIGNQRYAIQTVPNSVETSIELALGYKLAKSGKYTLKATSIEGLSENISVLLVDKLAGKTFDLRAKEEVIINLASEQTVNDRFTLKFFSNAVVSGIDDNSANNRLKVFGTTSELHLAYNASGLQEVNIHTLDGKLIQKDRVNFEGEKAMINTQLIKNQLYILSVDGTTIKFILK
jgi:hypothetical protein